MPKIQRIRKSTRLTEYDYSQPGAYFITINTYLREPLFGAIVDGFMVLYDAGRIVEKTWNDLPKHYPDIRLDMFVIMPNHVHGIISLLDQNVSLTEIVRAFKSFSARRINLVRRTSGIPVWQRGFHDHIIRDEVEFQRIADYIETNPSNWQKDQD